MSYSLDSDIQEDLRTFPMYQRLRKINPYAYYSLDTQKQMQLDLRKPLAEAEHWLDTGSPEFNEKTETVLALLYVTDTVPIRRCALHGDKHKVFAAMIVLMHEQSLRLEVNEYNTTDLRSFGYSMSFMQFLAKADARSVLNVMMRTKHIAIYCVSQGIVGVLSNGSH